MEARWNRSSERITRRGLADHDIRSLASVAFAVAAMHDAEEGRVAIRPSWHGEAVGRPRRQVPSRSAEREGAKVRGRGRRRKAGDRSGSPRTLRRTERSGRATLDTPAIRPVQPTSQPVVVRGVDAVAQLGLSLGQVLEGRVVEVQGRRATIDVGTRQLTAESRAPLAEGDQVVLRVRDASANVVRMEVLERHSPGALRTLSGPDLQTLLGALGLEPHTTLQGLARTLIALGLPLDPKALADLAARLAALGQTSPESLRAAALLQQLGLPVTAASLELARAYLLGDGPLGRALRGAGTQADRLAAALRRDSGELATALRGAIEDLHTLLGELSPFEGDGQLAERLALRSDELGTPLEAKLARWLDAEAPALGRDLRMALDRLLAELDAFIAEAPDGGLRREAEALRTALRHLSAQATFQQLTNAGQPPSGTEAGRFYVWQLPWAGDPGWESVRLKVQRDPEGRRLDPTAQPVHMRFEFDLAGLGPLATDVLVHRDRVACHFTSPDHETVQLLAAHGAELSATLESLGYQQPDVRSLHTPRRAEPAPPPAEPRRIDTVI